MLEMDDRIRSVEKRGTGCVCVCGVCVGGGGGGGGEGGGERGTCTSLIFRQQPYDNIECTAKVPTFTLVEN